MGFLTLAFLAVTAFAVSIAEATVMRRLLGLRSVAFPEFSFYFPERPNRQSKDFKKNGSNS